MTCSHMALWPQYVAIAPQRQDRDGILAWEVASDVAQRIRDLREAVGWTQAQLAQRVNRLVGAVSKWERGVKRPPRTVLERLAKQQGWPVEIFGEGGPMPSVVIRRRPEEGAGAVHEPSAFYGADEQAYRDAIRNVERSVRGMVDEAGMRELRLAACRGFMRQAELAGKAVPDFMARIYYEISEGTFR